MPQRRLFDARQGFDARQNQSAAGRRVGWRPVCYGMNMAGGGSCNETTVLDV